ncbi:MAG: EamA family transporter [Actinomycetes bacterium]
MNSATLARFLVLALLWGSSFTFIKVSLEGLTPSQLVLSRLVLGAAVLLAIAGVRSVGLPRSGGIWVHVAAAALLGNVVPFLLLSYGEQTTGAGLAGVLVGSTPLLTLTLAAAALPTERATPRKAVGLLIGFLGVVLVIGPWRDSLGSVGGQLACLGAALSYAAGFVYVRKHLSPRGLAPLALAASQLVAAAALQALVTPFLTWHTPHFTSRVTASIVILGLLCTGLAYVLYFRLIGDVGATTASAVNYVVPVGAVLISVVLLGEPVTWNLLAGGLVVLFGVAYAENRIKDLRRRSADSTHLTTRMRAVLMLLISSVVLGIGVALLLEAALGSDGYSTLINGLSIATGAPFVVVNCVVGVLLVAMAWARGLRPALGTVVQPVVVGVTVSAAMDVIAQPDHLALRGGLLLLALPVLAVGVAGYLGSGTGAGPAEAAALAWDPPIPFRWSYSVVQGGGALAGWLLGGAIGPGTLLVAFLLGPAVDLLSRRYRWFDFHAEDSAVTSRLGGQRIGAGSSP